MIEKRNEYIREETARKIVDGVDRRYSEQNRNKWLIRASIASIATSIVTAGVFVGVTIAEFSKSAAKFI